jgi:exonuclease III
MDSSHGCNGSLPSNNEPRTTLQPHEFVSNNKKEKQQKNGLTTVYTQNAQGLWRCPRDPDGNILVDKPPDLSKLEYLIDYMCQNDIGAWLVQETREEGNKFDVNVNGYHFFCRNANIGENGCQHLFRGIAIILSLLFYDAWKAAGSPPPITTDSNNDFVGRFIQMNLKFDLFDTRGQSIKWKSMLMALIFVYFPCKDQQQDQFCALLDSMLSIISPSTQIVMGGDINARIGIRTCNEHKETLGPHSIAQSNARGKNLLHVLAVHTLQVENTFFHHQPDEYATYTSLPTTYHPRGLPSMHDTFACPNSFHKRVQDCAMVLHGVASDHLAVHLKVSLASIKFKPCEVS